MELTLPILLLWMYFCIINMVVEPILSCPYLKAKNCEMSFHPPNVERRKNSNNNSMNIMDNNVMQNMNMCSPHHLVILVKIRALLVLFGWYMSVIITESVQIDVITFILAMVHTFFLQNATDNAILFHQSCISQNVCCVKCFSRFRFSVSMLSTLFGLSKQISPDVYSSAIFQGWTWGQRRLKGWTIPEGKSNAFS